MADIHETKEIQSKISKTLSKRDASKRREMKEQIEQYKFQKEMDA